MTVCMSYVWGECFPEPGCQAAEGPGTHDGELECGGEKENSRAEGGGIGWEKVSEFSGCQVVDGFLGEEECLVVNTGLHREPLLIVEYWCDVFS